MLTSWPNEACGTKALMLAGCYVLKSQQEGEQH